MERRERRRGRRKKKGMKKKMERRKKRRGGARRKKRDRRKRNARGLDILPLQKQANKRTHEMVARCYSVRAHIHEGPSWFSSSRGIEFRMTRRTRPLAAVLSSSFPLCQSRFAVKFRFSSTKTL